VRREHKILVSLDARELARLDELRPSGTARAVFLRQLLRGPSAGQAVLPDVVRIAARSPGERR
jgi:hypothetical protein